MKTTLSVGKLSSKNLVKNSACQIKCLRTFCFPFKCWYELKVNFHEVEVAKQFIIKYFREKQKNSRLADKNSNVADLNKKMKWNENFTFEETEKRLKLNLEMRWCNENEFLAGLLCVEERYSTFRNCTHASLFQPSLLKRTHYSLRLWNNPKIYLIKKGRKNNYIPSNLREILEDFVKPPLGQIN